MHCHLTGDVLLLSGDRCVLFLGMYTNPKQLKQPDKPRHLWGSSIGIEPLESADNYIFVDYRRQQGICSVI